MQGLHGYPQLEVGVRQVKIDEEESLVLVIQVNILGQAKRVTYTGRQQIKPPEFDNNARGTI